MLPEDKAWVLRREIVAAARRLHEQGLLPGPSGNLSARLDDERVLVVPSGVPKARLQPEELLIVDLGGRVLAGMRGLKPTSELPMHLEVYRRRSDVAAVVHAHPAAAVALTLAGISLQEAVLPEAVLLLGEVPTTAYATPSTAENRGVVAAWIGQHDVILLARHGALTVGHTLNEAVTRMEVLEHTAQTLLWAHLVRRPEPLPPEAVEKLQRVRATYGR